MNSNSAGGNRKSRFGNIQTKLITWMVEVRQKNRLSKSRGRLLQLEILGEKRTKIIAKIVKRWEKINSQNQVAAATGRKLATKRHSRASCGCRDSSLRAKHTQIITRSRQKLDSRNQRKCRNRGFVPVAAAASQKKISQGLVVTMWRAAARGWSPFTSCPQCVNATGSQQRIESSHQS